MRRSSAPASPSRSATRLKRMNSSSTGVAPRLLTRTATRVPLTLPQIGEDRLDQRIGYVVGGLQLLALDARLAMDAHADFHLVFGDGEGGLAGLRHGAGRQGDAHGAAAVGGALRDRGDAGEIEPGIGGGARDLEGQHHAGHAAALLALGERRARHVVGEQHGGAVNVVHLDELAGHVEVHDVAAVIAVEAQRRPHRHWPRAWRSPSPRPTARRTRRRRPPRRGSPGPT